MGQISAPESRQPISPAEPSLAAMPPPDTKNRATRLGLPSLGNTELQILTSKSCYHPGPSAWIQGVSSASASTVRVPHLPGPANPFPGAAKTQARASAPSLCIFVAPHPPSTVQRRWRMGFIQTKDQRIGLRLQRQEANKKCCHKRTTHNAQQKELEWKSLRTKMA